jgi:hypothetical protein
LPHWSTNRAITAFGFLLRLLCTASSPDRYTLDFDWPILRVDEAVMIYLAFGVVSFSRCDALAVLPKL